MSESQQKLKMLELAHEECVEALLERGNYSRSQNGWDTYTEKYLQASEKFYSALKALKESS